MGANKKKRDYPISWTMMIISVAWIAVVLFAVVMSGFASEQKTYEHVAGVVSRSVDSAMNMLQRDIDNVVEQSMDISYAPTLRNAYLEHEKTGDGQLFYEQIKHLLDEKYSNNQNIASVYIVFPEIENEMNQRYFTYNASLLSYDKAVDFYRYGVHEDAKMYITTMGTDIKFVRHLSRMYMVRLLSRQEEDFRPYGVMMVEINFPLLLKDLYSFLPLTDATIYINEITVAVLGSEIYPEGNFPKTYKTTFVDKTTLLIEGSPPSERYALSYYAKADLYLLISEAGTSVNAVFLIFFLCIPLFMSVIVFFYYRVTSPINRLSNLARNVENGIFGVQIDAEKMGSQEFVYLATQMNSMSSRLEDQFERLYREELALRDSRIKALQSQINPHFLGNTLEAINWEARLAGNEKVSNMLEALSTMMVAAIDRNRRPLVSLSEEMTYIDAYLYITKERLGKRLELEVEIDKELLVWNVPRLILQPIVENAVDHGVGKRTKGKISIFGKKQQDGYMLLEVINDSEMSEADQEKVAKILDLSISDEEALAAGNIGIRNVNQRLKIIYGGESELLIKNDNKGHTVSSLKIRHMDVRPE